MIPKGSRVFPTKPGLKEPRDGTHGHKDAVPVEQFDLALVPKYANYGIALDGQYLVVDFDDPSKVEAPFNNLPPTWKQKTRRGEHLLYYYTGNGHNRKFPGGDVKVKGYIMGPGSVVDGFTYEYVWGEVQPAPDWLVALVEALPDRTETPSEAVPGIAPGSHDDFLFKTAAWLRGQWGLEEETIERVLRKGPLEALEGVDSDDPYTDADLRRLARSGASYEPGEALATTALRCGTDVDLYPPRQEWILPGFVPAGQLTILYGDGKIGKSSWLSWLAARETQRGNKVVFVPAGEETFDLFVQRCRLNGGLDHLLYEYQDPTFTLLTGVPRLRTALEGLGGVTLVLIDALYSLFGESNGENEAVRARRNLLGLAQLCANTAPPVSVLGTIHENAQGNLLGSREMRNVCRSLLHATGGKGKSFTLWSQGGNAWSPDYGVAFPGRAVPVLRETGEQEVFEDLFGNKVPQSIWALDRGERVEAHSSSVSVDEVEESAEQKIRGALEMFPDLSNKGLIELTGLAPTTVMGLAGQIRTRMGMTPSKGGRPPKSD